MPQSIDAIIGSLITRLHSPAQEIQYAVKHVEINNNLSCYGKIRYKTGWEAALGDCHSMCSATLTDHKIRNLSDPIDESLRKRPFPWFEHAIEMPMPARGVLYSSPDLHLNTAVYALVASALGNRLVNTTIWDAVIDLLIGGLVPCGLIPPALSDVTVKKILATKVTEHRRMVSIPDQHAVDSSWTFLVWDAATYIREELARQQKEKA